ncbi:MAG: hypothetical protein GX804_04420 [Lentisphaerae bacterium]|jgi:hypothetical protein|nr:hypothetical protein [Lentisphaerota bacterium]
MKNQLLTVLIFTGIFLYARNSRASILEVRVDGELKYGGSVPVTLCITNSTPDNIVVPYEGVFSVFSISVKNSDGVDAMLTALGRHKLFIASLAHDRRIRVIKPGGEFSIFIYLNMLYDISLPDTYIMKVETSYSVEDDKKLKIVKKASESLKIDYRERRETSTAK